MADQSNKIGALKDELGRIKAQLKRTNLKPGEAQALLRRGRDLENMVHDLERIPNSQTMSEQSENTWGTDQPEEEDNETEYDEDGNPIEEDSEEGTDGVNNPESSEAKSKEGIAEQIETGIEKKEAEKKGFDSNTEAGQKAAAEAEKAKIAGGPAEQSAAPKEAPKAGPEEANLPGGKAIAPGAAPSADAGSTNGAKAAVKKAESNEGNEAASGGSLIDKIKQFGARAQTGIKDGAKKFGEKAKKNFSKEGMKLLLKIPAVRWTLIIIIVLALVGLVAFAIFGSLINNGNTGSTGSTYVQAVDPVKDKDWLSKLLQYSGDAEIKEEKSKEMIETTRKALTDIQSDATLPTALRGKATTALNSLSIFENSPTASRKAAGEKVIADIKSITDEFFSCRSIYLNNPFYYVGSLDSVPLKETDMLGTKNGLPAVAVNPRLCGLLLAMADPNTGVKFPTAKTPALKLGFRGTHSVYVGGDGPKDPKSSKSSHYCGNGLDINPGENTGMTDKTVGDTIRAWLFANEARLKTAKIFPEETFGPGPDYSSNVDNFARKTAIKEGKESFGPGYVSGHEDHTHIGFGGCK